MPIEIRELVIRTVVGGPATAESAQSTAPQQQGGGGGGALSAGQLDALVQECVRQVLLVLQRERER